MHLLNGHQERDELVDPRAEAVGCQLAAATRERLQVAADERAPRARQRAHVAVEVVPADLEHLVPREEQDGGARAEVGKDPLDVGPADVEHGRRSAPGALGERAFEERPDRVVGGRGIEVAVEEEAVRVPGLRANEELRAPIVGIAGLGRVDHPADDAVHVVAAARPPLRRVAGQRADDPLSVAGENEAVGDARLALDRPQPLVALVEGAGGESAPDGWVDVPHPVGHHRGETPLAGGWREPR